MARTSLDKPPTDDSIEDVMSPFSDRNPLGNDLDWEIWDWWLDREAEACNLYGFQFMITEH